MLFLKRMFKLCWLKIIVSDLKVEVKEPMMLYCDNKATINIAHNLVHHDWTTLVEVDKHLIKETLDIGKVALPMYHLRSSLQMSSQKDYLIQLFIRLSICLGCKISLH